MSERLEMDDGVGLYLRVVGDGASTVVVPTMALDADLERLAEGGHRVAFYDVRNRGRSDAVEDPALLGFHREVADLAAVVDHLDPASVSVLGWGYVAGVAAMYAVGSATSVERLVLVAPMSPRTDVELMTGTGPRPAALAELDQLAADGLEARAPEEWCRAWRRVHLAGHVGDVTAFDRMVSRPCAHPNEWPAHLARAVAHVLVDLGRHDWRPELARLAVPTLVLQGSADPTPRTAGVEWVTTIPDARLLSLEGVGRYPWLESPEVFFAAVTGFLAGRWPDASRR